MRVELKHAEVEAKIRAACVKSLNESALLIETRSKLACPVDTGNLRRSITHQIEAADLTAEVSANASYAAYLEFGTRKMRAQPYLRPAGDNSRRDVERIFQRNLRAVK